MVLRRFSRARRTDSQAAGSDSSVCEVRQPVSSVRSRVALRRAQREFWLLIVSMVVMLLLGLSILAFPYVKQYIDRQQQLQLTSQVRKDVSSWPLSRKSFVLQNAQEYNRRLYESGQSLIGEVVDPYSGQGRVDVQNSQAAASSGDEEYLSELRVTGEGVMGSVQVPKIDLNLPIFHGTGVDSLDHGAGHLYGTSLPVGGVNTHTVLTGHRGLVEALMFTRIDELRSGDDIMLHVLDETLVYEVDSVRVILPDEGSKFLRIVPGQDRLTLLTCTPYGVNTHRLLVSGHRVSRSSSVTGFSGHANYFVRYITIFMCIILLLCTLLWFLLHSNPKFGYCWVKMCHARNRCGM